MKLDEVANRAGLSLPELFEILKEDSYDLSIYKLSDDKYEEYKKLFIQLNTPYKSAAEKGRAFEEIVSFLLENIGVYNISKNKRTSTNEIDIFLRRKITFDFASDRFPRHILCECKNYSKSISVTYIGKFYSLLHTSRTSIGLLFSYKSITGRSNWSAGKGLCRKIALRDNIHIINITYDDLKQIYLNNVSIIKIIEEKRTELEQDINFEYADHELCQDKEFCTVN